MEVTVSDAQYVWRGDPMEIPPNPNESQAYFVCEIKGYVGKSAVEKPFNRSCRCEEPDLAPPPNETEPPNSTEPSATEESHIFPPRRIE